MEKESTIKPAQRFSRNILYAFVLASLLVSDNAWSVEVLSLNVLQPTETRITILEKARIVVSVSGDGESDTSVTVNGVNAVSVGDLWQADVELLIGLNRLDVIARCSSGQTAQTVVTIERQVAPAGLLMKYTHELKSLAHSGAVLQILDWLKKRGTDNTAASQEAISESRHYAALHILNQIQPSMDSDYEHINRVANGLAVEARGNEDIDGDGAVTADDGRALLGHVSSIIASMVGDVSVDLFN